MAQPKLRRRGHREDAIYFVASKNRYVGAVSLGFTPEGKRIRRKVSGKTKQEVRDKLKALHQELDVGVRSSAGYTVRRAVEDWLGEGLHGRSERTTTLYAGLLQPVLEIIGAKPLRDLTAGDVRLALGQLTSRYSTRSLQITRNSLDRAIQHAQADDLVARNVAALVKPPMGRSGRPSRSFTLEQAKALLAVTEGSRWHAYVALSLLAGIRTEEARALRWDHVVTWADDTAGWQPVTMTRFRSRAERERTASRSMSGVPSGTGETPRPGSHGDPGTSPALRRGTPGAPKAPGEGPPAGRGNVARPRPGSRFYRRYAAERQQRDPLIPDDH